MIPVIISIIITVCLAVLIHDSWFNKRFYITNGSTLNSTDLLRGIHSYFSKKYNAKPSPIMFELNEDVLKDMFECEKFLKLNYDYIYKRDLILYIKHYERIKKGE